MHAAPPVRVSLGPHWGWPGFVGLCAGAAAGNLAAWLLLKLEVDHALPLAAALALAVAATAGWIAHHRADAHGELGWDGAQWHWLGTPGHAAVAVDIGSWMLLRFQPLEGRGPRWIAAARARTAGSWGALRAALYSRRPDDPADAPTA